jgi:hypothetical protein
VGPMSEGLSQGSHLFRSWCGPSSVTASTTRTKAFGFNAKRRI